MPTFEEYVAALQARDTIKQLVRTEMAAMRPEYRYGLVQSIDRQQRECTVQFPEGGDPVTVQMGSIQPARVGQVVRVDGLGGDRFVSDVIGDSYNDRTHPLLPDQHLFLGVGGSGVGLSINGWNNLVVNNAAYFAMYDQSAGALNNYKEQRIWLDQAAYLLYAFVLKGPNVGIMSFYDNGSPLVSHTPFDTYNASYVAGLQMVGAIYAYEPGWHTIRVQITGKNASSSNYYGLLSSLLVHYAVAL